MHPPDNPPAGRPPGRAVIRPAVPEDALAMAHVHVDTWHTTYAGIVPAEHLARLSYERSQAAWNEHLLDQGSGERAFVAEDPASGIVGLASGGPLRKPLASFDGELYVLYILKPFQGMGYGRQLVCRVAQSLQEAGFHSMVLWVLKENPACGFYARLGGQPVAEKVIEIGGKALVDVAYAWHDLGGLTSP